MYRTVQMVLAGLLAVVFGLSALSRRFPRVGWLQIFRYNRPQLSEEQQAKIRHRANVHAGLEMILMGIVLPILYLGATVMFFNQMTKTEAAVVLSGAALLIGLGVAVIVRNRRP